MDRCHRLFSVFSIAFVLSSLSFNMLAIHEITSEQEFYQILQQEERIIALFYATWSAPSQHMMIMLETIEKEFPTILFVKVDTDSLRHLALIFHIRRLPTVVFFKTSEEIERIAELIPKNQLEELINNLYP